MTKVSKKVRSIYNNKCIPLYCCPANQSYVENGLRKWENIITFERSLWKEIQNKILKKYEELKNGHKREKTS